MDNKIYNIIYNKIYTTFASQRARNDLEEKNLQNMAFICFVSDEIRLYLGNNLGKNFLFLLWVYECCIHVFVYACLQAHMCGYACTLCFWF